MKTINITVDSSGVCALSDDFAGNCGEHNSLTLSIKPNLTFFENCEYYKINIDGRYSESLEISGGLITYTVPQGALCPPVISCQVVGFKTIDDKSVLICRTKTFKLKVEPSPGAYVSINTDALEPLETALSLCGNAIAVAENKINELTEISAGLGERSAELETIASTALAETQEAAAAAGESADTAASHQENAAVSAQEAAGYMAQAETHAANASAYSDRALEYVGQAADWAGKAAEAAQTHVSAALVDYVKTEDLPNASVARADAAGALVGSGVKASLNDNSTKESGFVIWSSQRTMTEVDSKLDDYVKTDALDDYVKTEDLPNASVARADAAGVLVGGGVKASFNDNSPATMSTLWSSEKTMTEVNSKLEDYAKTEDLPAEMIVDMAYDPTSANAQSGTAVAEALGALKSEIVNEVIAALPEWTGGAY